MDNVRSLVIVGFLKRNLDKLKPDDKTFLSELDAKMLEKDYEYFVPYEESARLERLFWNTWIPLVMIQGGYF